MKQNDTRSIMTKLQKGNANILDKQAYVPDM